MGCPYEFYKDETIYYPRLYCNIDNKYCMYVKRCLKVEKFIPLDGDLWKECYKYMENKAKNIPKGSNYIELYKPNKNGKLYLYVNIEGNIVKILSNFTNINQNYIYLKEGLDGYEISLIPFEDEKKKNYSSNKGKKIKTEEE